MKPALTMPVDHARCQRDRHCRPERPALLGIEDGKQHAGQREDARHREIVVAGGERDDQRQRQDDQHRLRAEDRGDVGPGQERVGPERPEDGAEHDDAGDQRIGFGEAHPIEAPGRRRPAGSRRGGLQDDWSRSRRRPSLRSTIPASERLRRHCSAMLSLVISSPVERPHDPPAGEYEDAIADLRKLLVVGAGAEHRGPLARSLVEGLEQRLARADVDALRRLVEDEQLRLGLQPLGEQHLLLVAAAEEAELERRAGSGRTS